MSICLSSVVGPKVTLRPECEDLWSTRILGGPPALEPEELRAYEWRPGELLALERSPCSATITRGGRAGLQVSEEGDEWLVWPRLA